MAVFLPGQFRRQGLAPHRLALLEIFSRSFGDPLPRWSLRSRPDPGYELHPLHEATRTFPGADASGTTHSHPREPRITTPPELPPDTRTGTSVNFFPSRCDRDAQ